MTKLQKGSIPVQTLYAIFAGQRQDAGGGWNDFQGTFKTHFLSVPLLHDKIDQVDCMLMDRESAYGWIQVVNLDEMKMSYCGKKKEGKWLWENLTKV